MATATTKLGEAAPGPIQRLGEQVFEAIAEIGDMAHFTALTFTWLVRKRPNSGVLTPNFYAIGVSSVPVVWITGTFIGMVLAVQAHSQFAMMGLETRLGSVINISLVKELGPVLAATMLAGRVGSSMSAELGTMRVTEQIDALISMAVDPIQYLIVPRVFAGIIMLPILTMFFDIIGFAGSYLVGVVMLGISHGTFVGKTQWLVDPIDIYGGLIKSAFFGGIITMIGCYKGFNAEGGARGVGEATTSAVVASFVAILVLDYFLTVVIFAT